MSNNFNINANTHNIILNPDFVYDPAKFKIEAFVSKVSKKDNYHNDKFPVTIKINGDIVKKMTIMQVPIHGKDGMVDKATKKKGDPCITVCSKNFEGSCLQLFHDISMKVSKAVEDINTEEGYDLIKPFYSVFDFDNKVYKTKQKKYKNEKGVDLIPWTKSFEVKVYFTSKIGVHNIPIKFASEKDGRPNKILTSPQPLTREIVELYKDNKKELFSFSKDLVKETYKVPITTLCKYTDEQLSSYCQLIDKDNFAQSLEKKFGEMITFTLDSPIVSAGRVTSSWKPVLRYLAVSPLKHQAAEDYDECDQLMMGRSAINDLDEEAKNEAIEDDGEFDI